MRVNNLPGGTPLTADEQRESDQLKQLAGVVAEAFRLLPVTLGAPPGVGSGQGEGVSRDLVDTITQSLLELRSASGGDAVPVLDWLSTGLSCAPRGESGDLTVAALRVRDILLEGLLGLINEQRVLSAESEVELSAAELFAEGAIEVEVP